MKVTLKGILAERIRRQRLASPLRATKDYVELFRSLQPVSTIRHTRPGDPPSLWPRTRFSDKPQASRLRAKGRIVKGRFLGGSIGYVLAEDLGVYANAFRRPLDRLSEIQQTVLQALQNTGPLTPRQIKEETGLLNKQIMPALHRLQTAFMVYEDQTDTDWERGWYIFSSEWPEIELSDSHFESAATQVLLRFLRGHVFATSEQLKDWSQLPQRQLANLLQMMEDTKLIIPKEVAGLGQGWVCSGDKLPRDGKVKPRVFMLHKADMLVRSHASELKRRFGNNEVLQYLLIDGKVQGAVLGHWRIGPHDVSDIIVDLPADQRKSRQEEILAVVSQQYSPPHSRILKYAGKTLPKN